MVKSGIAQGLETVSNSVCDLVAGDLVKVKIGGTEFIIVILEPDTYHPSGVVIYADHEPCIGIKMSLVPNDKWEFCGN